MMILVTLVDGPLRLKRELWDDPRCLTTDAKAGFQHRIH